MTDAWNRRTFTPPPYRGTPLYAVEASRGIYYYFSPGQIVGHRWRPGRFRDERVWILVNKDGYFGGFFGVSVWTNVAWTSPDIFLSKNPRDVLPMLRELYQTMRAIEDR